MGLYNFALKLDALLNGYVYLYGCEDEDECLYEGVSVWVYVNINWTLENFRGWYVDDISYLFCCRVCAKIYLECCWSVRNVIII